MRIVYLYNALAITGGLERIIIDKMNYFAEIFGYEVYIITWQQSNHKVIYPLSSKVTHIDLNTRFFTLYRFNRLKRSVLYLRMRRKYYTLLKQEITKIKPDIIITVTLDSKSIPFLRKTFPASFLITESHSSKTKDLKYEIQNKKFVPNYLANILLYILTNRLKKSDCLVTLTEGDAKEWNLSQKVHIIPNILTYYPPEVRSSDKKKVITVGRLEVLKGFDLLIKAWKIVHKKHPSWILEIYGDGSEKNNLQQLIEKNELSQSLIINDPTPHIYEKYMDSAFYVMSSRTEAFGLVLPEAMSCGIPCISFDCPYGPSTIINHNEDGILVKNGDIYGLADSICYLIEHEDIRREMGMKARENVKRYLPEYIMPQWDKLFKSLIKKKKEI